MLSLPEPKIFFAESAGKRYRINYTPEAVAALTAQAIHFIAAPTQNPFTPDKIAHLLACHTFEGKAPILNAPHAMMYGCRSKDKVYQVIASLLPDANDGLPVCEVHRFQESTDLEFNKLVH